MSYSPNPIYSTYSAKEIQVSTDILLRPSSLATGLANITQDAGMVNLLSIKEDSEEVAITRPGIVTSGTPPAGKVRGFHNWDTGPTSVGSHLYVCVDDKVYFQNGGSWVLKITWSGSTGSGPVRFAEFIDDVNTKKLIVVDGIDGYILDTSAVATHITSVNFPTPHVPFPVFLDGYIFLAKQNTGDVYNCDLNTPDTWTAGNFLSAEMYPDNINALVRAENYIVVIGSQSTEYFYDAGNSPGTPLARVEGASLPIGCLAVDSIATNKGSIVMLANNNDGQYTVAVIENQRYSDIGANFVVPLFMAKSALGFADDTTARGYFFRHRSELFYVLSFGDGIAYNSSSQTPTFAYSFSTKKWAELRFGSDGTSAFPVYFTQGATRAGTSTWCAGHFPNAGATVSFIGYLHDFTGQATDSVPSSTPFIYQEFRTATADMGTMNRKWMNRLGLVADVSDSTLVNLTSDPVNVTLSWTDNDYKTWSAGVSLNLSTQDTGGNNIYYPFVTQLGSFIRRAFRVIYTGKPMMFRKLVAAINKGQQ